MILPNQSRIPFNRACFFGNEQRYIAQAIANGHISGDGPFTRACSDLLSTELQGAKVFLTTSCTHALEMSALLLNIGPGDEVILPSFTFVSTANAFVLRGARPVFVDIRSDTLNLDEMQLERAITSRTRAIVPVHYAGVGCEMDVILEIAERHGIAVIEDNAHGLLGGYRGKPLGTFGSLSTLSFHETKNFTCGEGGALVINDPQYIDNAEILREKGTNRARFYRGMVDKYTWVGEGSSYLPSDVLAAFLLAQLEARETVQSRRRNAWERYASGLAGWAEESGVGLPQVPGHCTQAYHMFYLIMPNLELRQALIRHLAEQNIIAVFHYVPLHRSEMAQRLGAHTVECPVTDSVADRLIRLPFYNDITDSDLDRVISGVTSFAMQVYR
jgi:dTDP-4-amino-4,6-dideoxygalactose transaminase